jgi:hypothetical protein
MKKLFILFAILCLAAPAMAADWNFYGSARFATFYSIVDKDAPPPNDDSINRTIWQQQGNSRIGANVKVNDQISGSFEMSDSFGKRKLFGKYTFGGGSELLIGQTYTPTSKYFYSNSVYATDGDLLGVGQFYAGRNPMVQWKMGGLAIAGVSPNIPDDEEGVSAVDLIIPKIEASYNYKADAWFFDVAGGFQTYDIDYFADGASDPTVMSYTVMVGGGMNFGAFYVNLGANFGQNYEEYGAGGPSLAGVRAINQSGLFTPDEERDNETWGFLGVLGFNASDTWTFEAGYGYQKSELDVAGDSDESLWQAYVNAVWNIAPGFFIVPEVGFAEYDYAGDPGEGASDAPTLFYAGAKWQINF